MRIGLVGLGRWGSNYLPILSRHRDFELVGLCDIEPRALERAGSETAHLARYSSLPALLAAANVEAVVIATPPETHVALARLALAAHAHVLVEKPIAMSVESAETLVAAVSRAKRVCAVGHLALHQHRGAFDPGAPIAAEVGSIREVRAIRTSLGAAHSAESALFGLASHDVATLLGPLGLDPLRVRARSTSRARPDQAVRVEMRLRSRRDGELVSAELVASRLGPERVRRLEIVGTQGSAAIDELAFKPGADVLTRQCDAFAARIRARDYSAAEAELGASVVRVVHAAARSLASESWVDIAAAPRVSVLTERAS